MGTSIEWIRDPDRFAELAEPWNELADGFPFDLHCWFAAWWKAFGDGAELAVCAAWHGDRLAAVFPLTRPSPRRLQGMANVHSPVFRPLARDDDSLRTVVAAALTDDVSSIEVWALPDGDPALAALTGRTASSPWLALVEHQHISPIVDIEGTLDNWTARNKRRWRADIPRLRRKMAREHRLEQVIVEAPADLERDLEQGLRVEASGWKGRRGTAILAHRDTASFYREIARAFHARGELRLSTLLLDGEAVAFDLSLLYGDQLYLLKTGYDERFRRLAPGLVLRLSVIERCFELGLSTHELLGDDAEWKRKFSSRERCHSGFRAYAPRPMALSRYGYRRFARPVLKEMRQRLRSADV